MPRTDALRHFAIFTLSYCLASLACSSVSARDDVPDDVESMKNPVTLEESEIRYYQRQFKGKCSRCHGLDGTGTGVDCPGAAAGMTVARIKHSAVMVAPLSSKSARNRFGQFGPCLDRVRIAGGTAIDRQPPFQV